MVHLLPLFDSARYLMTEPQPEPGGAPPTAPYSFAGLKEYAENDLRCAGHVWLARTVTSIEGLLIDQESTYPPQEPRLL